MPRKLGIGILLIVVVLAAYGVVYASIYNGTVDLTCTSWSALGTGSHVLDRDNTGSGREALRIDITDGAGTLIYTLSYSNFLGTFPSGIGSDSYTSAPQYNPLTFTLTSLAGNGLPEQVDYVQQGNCAGLPNYAGCIVIPADAIVGDMPFSTQAYYEPGNLSSAVLNPGTYWVLGTDESGAYYKIVLACQYLWVPVGSMQPSFQPPWQGQPLPTGVVS